MVTIRSPFWGYNTIYFMTYFYARISGIVSTGYNGSYTTIDGGRLIAVANTLRALVLGGVH